MASRTQTQTNTATKAELKKPKKYFVIIHNDDYTSMEFVVEVLMNIFNKSEQDASNIMLEVHQNGKGVAGEYIYDIAVTKKMQTEQLAAQRGFPLKISLEEAVN